MDYIGEKKSAELDKPASSAPKKVLGKRIDSVDNKTDNSQLLAQKDSKKRREEEEARLKQAVKRQEEERRKIKEEEKNQLRQEKERTEREKRGTPHRSQGWRPVVERFVA